MRTLRDYYSARAPDLSQASVYQLNRLRDVVPSAMQDVIGPQEHQAFTREWVNQNPLLGAASAAVATPGYTALKGAAQNPLVANAIPGGAVLTAIGKALGYGDPSNTQESRASLEEILAAYKGIGQGIADVTQGTQLPPDDPRVEQYIATLRAQMGPRPDDPAALARRFPAPPQGFGQISNQEAAGMTQPSMWQQALDYFGGMNERMRRARNEAGYMGRTDW